MTRAIVGIVVLAGSIDEEHMAGRDTGGESDGQADTFTGVGQRVHSRRIQRGFTLAGMSERTGLSKGYLSRIENGRKSPPLDTLRRLARALGTDVAVLLSDAPGADADDPPAFSVVRAERRAHSEQPESAFGYVYQQLIGDDVRPALRPYLLHLPAEVEEHVFFEHGGQEFMFVLEGRVEWVIGTQHVVLEPGDALYLDSRIAHHARAIGGPAKALVVFAPQRGQTDPKDGWRKKSAPARGGPHSSGTGNHA
jgi:transcriptional regulator with XRE-family HTH domain